MLEVDGNPAGAIYLDHGQITFAQASWIPDLRSRLTGALQRSPGSRELPIGPDRPDRDIGSILVQRNYLSRDALLAILHSVIVDAAIVLTVRADEDAYVSDIRFAAPGAHWAGAFSHLQVDVVRSEVVRRVEHLARQPLDRTAAVRLSDLGRPSAVLTREQWAIASAIDGTLSVQDLAWRCGMALYDAIECAGYLIRAGLCVPGAPGPGGPGGAGGPGSARMEPLVPPPALEPGPVLPSAVLSPSSVMAPPRAAMPARPVMAPAGPRHAALPQRQAGVPAGPVRPVMSAPVQLAAVEPPAGIDFAPAQPELLRRVLDGLRRIS